MQLNIITNTGGVKKNLVEFNFKNPFYYYSVIRFLLNSNHLKVNVKVDQ